MRLPLDDRCWSDGFATMVYAYIDEWTKVIRRHDDLLLKPRFWADWAAGTTEVSMAAVRQNLEEVEVSKEVCFETRWIINNNGVPRQWFIDKNTIYQNHMTAQISSDDNGKNVKGGVGQVQVFTAIRPNMDVACVTSAMQKKAMATPYTVMLATR